MESKQIPKEKCWTKSHLKTERLWTEMAINTMLGKPDREDINFYYKSGPKVQRFSQKRVLKIEKSSKFKKWHDNHMANRDARRASALRSLETKKNKLRKVAQVAVSKMKLEIKDEVTLIAEACDSYNARPDRGQSATIDSDEAFIHRICVNYLRHEHTPYEYALEQMSGRSGSRHVKEDMREIIMDAIAEAYPWLALECYRQQGEWSMKQLMADR